MVSRQRDSPARKKKAMNQLGLFDPPPPVEGKPSPKYEGLRYYQREAIEKVLESFQDNHAVLMVMATGLGKTVCFSSIAQNWAGPVVVLAHRTELIHQAAATLRKLTGEPVGIEQANLYAHNHRIVVASIQTLCRDERRKRIEQQFATSHPGKTPLVIIDECHHYVSRTYLKTVQAFLKEGAKVLGVTATPEREDRKALGKIFDDYPAVIDIENGIDMGYLVPIRGKEVKVAAINLDNVSQVAGDFNQGQLDEEMLKAGEIIARSTLQEGGDRQGIIFCPGVQSAHLVAAKLNALKPHSARAIDGKTDREERARITQEFREGKIQYLSNCQVATEGFDAPNCSLIVLARPTQSAALYTQMVGRGTRVLPRTVDHLHGADQAQARREAVAASPKKDLLLLPITGECKRELATITDVLGGNYSEEEVATAKKIQKKRPGANALDSLRSARKALQDIARRSQARFSARAQAFDPFNVLNIQRSKDSSGKLTRFGHQPLAVHQREYLERKKVPKEVIQKMNKQDFTRFKKEIHRRQQRGLATYAQLAHLKRFGVTSTMVTFKGAKKGLDYIASKKWNPKRVDLTVLDRLTAS